MVVISNHSLFLVAMTKRTYLWTKEGSFSPMKNGKYVTAMYVGG